MCANCNALRKSPRGTALARIRIYSGAQQATYDFTLSLGTTNRTPGNPGSSYSGTFTPVFSGIVPVNFTNPRSFDFNIPLSTPFLYNPALGNLLMDVVMHSATDSPPGSSLFAWSQNDPQLGRVYNSSGTGPATAGPNNGLVTRFTGATTVPDSGATVLLLGAGVAALVGVRRTLHLRTSARLRLSREKVELVDLHFDSKSHLPALFDTYL
jgi:hypothetical protein